MQNGRLNLPALDCATVSLRDWDDAKAQIGALGSHWIFRGQQEAGWALQSSLERAIPHVPPLTAPRLAEDLLLKAFKRDALNYLIERWTPISPLDWLALFQHCGGPTRLLD